MNVTVRGRTRHYRTVAFDAEKNCVLLIEQRLLPHEFKIVAAPDFRATARAIKDMIVRGAMAIGVSRSPAPRKMPCSGPGGTFSPSTPSRRPSTSPTCLLSYAFSLVRPR